MSIEKHTTGNPRDYSASDVETLLELDAILDGFWIKVIKAGDFTPALKLYQNLKQDLRATLERIRAKEPESASTAATIENGEPKDPAAEFTETPDLGPRPADLLEASTEHGYYFVATRAKCGDSNFHEQSVQLAREEYEAAKRFVGLRRGVLKLDGLPFKDYKITPEEGLAELDKVDAHDAQLLALVLRSFRDGAGAMSPVEDFIQSILIAYGSGSLTPGLAAMRLEEFRDNVDLVRDAYQVNIRRHAWIFETTQSGSCSGV